ncbi:geranylgeranylglycerol-phosphate geranylgeranyltransferase [Aestuariibaculum sediminum]|uniref:Geranylgeranylglycerol-phosphate geranylgeranyltransferase n=1 Tax=Aestuariibaculum sediminum TaxID=2770637 RepID=A0A8J6UFU5_9FLAO|nr:geranylgeranylglycerol-phosphate geranylgeranyltransferase [Aestuariibaculum sediminum]MBD0831691.1 geranylgeranylglycerol-phosphate geranylgeranyltransferase [Aestuariibaculum sediminum]
MKYLKLIRWQNLIMIVITQLLIKYAFLDPFGVATSLDVTGITVLIVSTLCIAAAGNIINDICDVETDTINKPNKVLIGKSISEKTAYNLFIILNVTGVGLGYYLAASVNRNAFLGIFVIISALLYIYATYLKQLALIGNLVISSLVSCSILIVGVFELIPVITPENQNIQLVIFKIIFKYVGFAFVINLLREIVKDIEDEQGDREAKMKTLPIVLGRKTTKNIVIILSLAFTVTLFFYVFQNLYKSVIANIYFIALIIGPLIYNTLKLFNAESNTDYHQVSSSFKIIMLFGMLSLLLYKYILLAK